MRNHPQPYRVAWLVPLLALLLAPAARPQVAVVKVGDNIPGVGPVAAIDEVAIDDGGSWMARVRVDESGLVRLVLVDGAVALIDGQPLPDAGGLLSGFADVDLEGSLVSLVGVGGNLGAFVGTELVLREGDAVAAPELPAGDDYVDLFALRSGGAGVLAVSGTFGDTSQPGLADRVLTVLHVDGKGDVISESAAAFEGMSVGGASITQLVSSTITYDVNAAGSMLYAARLDQPVGLQAAVLLDGTILAQEGVLSPVAGREWLSLDDAASLADTGSAAFIGSLDGDSATNFLLVRDGAKVVQEGDPLALDDGFTLRAFGPGPIVLGNNGNLLYHASWNGSIVNADSGLFLNDRLAVAEGVTAIDGSRVDEFVTTPTGYDLSPDGEWLIFRATLDDDTVGAFVLEIGPWVSVGQGLAGTDGKTPALVGAGSLVAGTPGTLVLSNARPLAPATLIVGFAALEAPFKGGTLVPTPTILIPVATSASGGLSLSWASWPAGIPGGTQLFMQYWVADAGGPAGFSASNGLRAEPSR